MEIVKVQTSLMKRDAPAIVSAKDDVRRSTLQKLDAKSRQAMNGAAKAFFKASFVNGKWKLWRKVEDQDW